MNTDETEMKRDAKPRGGYGKSMFICGFLRVR
jgi:hypothetical protein